MVAPHLQSTWEMLRRAFPSGISKEQYLPLLSLLYPHMADENLSAVMAEFMNVPVGEVLNDVYKVGSPSWLAPRGTAIWEEVVQHLKSAGFDEWIETDD